MIEPYVAGLLMRLLPVATSAGKTVTGHQARKQSQFIEKALLRFASGPDALRLSFTGDLTRRGLDEREIEETMEFLATDSGFEAVRLAFIATLAPSIDKDEVGALAQHVTALMALEAKRESKHHKEASRIIIGTVARGVREIEDSVRQTRLAGSQFDPLPRLRREARDQRLEAALLGKGHIGRRSINALALASQLPLELEDQVRQYVGDVEHELGVLQISTLQGVMNVSLRDAYVFPTFTDAASGTSLNFTMMLDKARDSRRLVLLGEPGSGKSTALQRLVLEMTDQFATGRSRLIPFRIVLRHYNAVRQVRPDIGFLRYLADRISEREVVTDPMPMLRYLCHVGRAVFLFDGLDEILQHDERARVASLISSLSQAFPSTISVLAARDAGYRDTAPYGFVSEVTTAPFSDEQTHTFVNTFLASGNITTPDITATRFMAQTQNIPDLRCRPLLLGVLCALYCAGRTLPSNRVELYAKCAEMLFDAWDQSKGLTLSFEYREAAEEATRELALLIFESGDEEISEPEILSVLSGHYRRDKDSLFIASERFAREALRYWKGRKWLLVFVGTREGIDYYRFSHRTFLEYFAAQELVFRTHNAADLWAHLEEYLLSRTAVSYSLLCIQMLSDRQRGATDAFFNLCAQQITNCSNLSPPIESFNLAVTGVEALACTKGTADVRLKLVASYIDLLRLLLPILHRAQVAFGLPSIGYSDVFEPESHPAELPEPEEMGAYTPGGLFTVQEVMAPLRKLSELRPIEQAKALSQISVSVLNVAKSDPEVALRIALALRQAGALESWTHVSKSYAHNVSALGDALWDQIVELLCDGTAVSVMEDAWVRIHVALRQVSDGSHSASTQARRSTWSEVGPTQPCVLALELLLTESFCCLWA